MAQALSIVYELHKEPTSQDYKKIVSTIKDYDHIKIGGSEYCIYTSDSPETVSNKLKPYIEDKERLLVIKITKPMQGWLTEDQWEWLNSRL